MRSARFCVVAIVLALCSLTSLAWGQLLTSAQLVTLKADILADPVLNSFPMTPDGAVDIALAYNQFAVPDFWVFRTNVPIKEVGDAFNGTELAGLTTANNERLQTVALYSTVINASLANRRQFFNDIFSGAGGTNTRANLEVLWRRKARRIEKLFATGTGSTASPATLVFEGSVTHTQVQQARELP